MKLIISVIVAVLLLPQVAAALCVQGDCMNGQGTFVLQDGRKYVGEFKEGIRFGRGLMTFPDGTKYLGDWQNDKPYGQGTLSSVGKFEYAGEFYNGVRHGQGTLETVDGKKYVGQWQNDVPHGQGKITYPDGSEFVGQFEDGRRNGEGEVTYSDGIKYIGLWKDDLPNGQGTRIYPDGKQYSGEFVNGLMHGQGTIVMPDGSKFIGQWQGDVLVKKEEMAPEIKFSTAEETVGHVIAVVDEKPAEVKVVPAETKVDDAESKMVAAEVKVVPAENKMVAEPVYSAPKVNVDNSSADYASVNQNGVFVRSGPSAEYRVIRSVYKGFPVQIIGGQDNWTQIKDFMGQEGWIYTPLLGSNNSAVVTATKANLRSGPGLQFMVVNQVNYGAVLLVNNIKDDWYMVTTPGGLEGWLSRELVWPAGHVIVSSQDSSDTATMVAPENLQMDQEAGPKDQVMVQEVKVAAEEQQPSEPVTREIQPDAADIVKDQQQEIQKGLVEEVKVAAERTEVEKVVEAEPAVSSIEIGSKTEEAGKEGVYASVSQNGRGANIRSEPSLAAEVLRSIPPGFPLAIVERQGDWVLVEDFRERRGWVYSTLLSDPGSVVIKVGKGNLRSGPGLTNEIIAKLDYGTVMFLDETLGEWVQVSNPEGLVGWLHNEVIWP
jgi:SH3-like domain-containing protein